MKVKMILTALTEATSPLHTNLMKRTTWRFSQMPNTRINV